MSEPTQPSPSDREEGQADLDEVDVRDLLRRALDTPPGAPRSVLDGVQGRLRQETKGRYFSDGWSTSASPRAAYLVRSLVMLLILALVWLLLAPYGVR